MSINDPLQKISLKTTFYFNIFKESILDFFWELTIKQDFCKFFSNMFLKFSRN